MSDAGFAAADLVREEHFHYAEVTHAMMEPNASLAEYDPERGRLTLHTVSQVPYYVHLALARCLGIDESRIRVVKPFVGGGFGHRTETLNFEVIAALLARAAGGNGQARALARGMLPHPPRPARDRRAHEDRHDANPARSPPSTARSSSAAALTRATAW